MVSRLRLLLTITVNRIQKTLFEQLNQHAHNLDKTHISNALAPDTPHLAYDETII